MLHIIDNTYLGQLLGDIPTYKNGFQVDPEILHNQPVLKNLCCIGEVFHPLLDGFLEGGIIPELGRRQKTGS